MTDRREVDRAVLLRAGPGPRDVVRAARLLAGTVPAPRRAAARIGLLTIGEVGAQVGVALVAKELLEQATRPAPQFAWQMALVGVALAAAGFFLLRARQTAQESIVLAARSRAVERLAGHIHHAPYEDLAAVPMADLREVIMTDVEFAYRFLLETGAQLVVIALWLVAAVVLFAFVSPPLLGLLAVIAVVFAVASVGGTRRHMALTAERFRRLSDLSQRARDVVEVDRVVVARQFGLDDLLVRRFMEAHRAFVAVALAQGRLAAHVRSALLTLGAVAFLAVVALGAALITTAALSVAELVALIFVVGQLLAAVAQVADAAHRGAETAAAGRRIASYWEPDERPDVPPAAAAPVRALAARDVRFRYGDGPLVLDGITIDLERGRLACLTAETGAGKSTLALLLSGLLTAEHGTVAVNGDEGLTPDRIGSGRILYVGSRPVLFEGSVRDNLLLGAGSEARDDDIERFFSRLERAGERLPLDDLVIGPNGTGVSSGQAQLIQLGRAVFREPDVVIFDEATSALDMETEAVVQRDLIDWCRARVCLVVSHRRCPWVDEADERLTLRPAEGALA